MKRQVVLVGLCLWVASGAWAQESCHWYGITKGFYRLIGSNDSEVVSIFSLDGAFVWENTPIGGTSTVEANWDLNTTNWIRQEHLAYSNQIQYQMTEITEPSCVPKTGQTIPYTAGGDGHLQKGHGWPDPRFTIQSDTNLVVDNLTGLMWMRNADGGHGTWDLGVSFCLLLDEFGYDDWRMPSVREMESLMDLGEFDPALPDLHPFKNVGTNYWTSTADIVEASKAWVVSMSGGTIAKLSRTNDSLSVWPVRSHTFGPAPVPKTGQTISQVPGDDGDLQPGQPWPIPRFTVMTDTNVVFDNLYGRMWTRQAGLGGLVTWSNAVDISYDLEWGGYDDWRLPNRKEAWSLIDYGSPTYVPAGSPFIGGGPFLYWTSSTYNSDPTKAWGLFSGSSGPFLKSFPEGAMWPVRGDW